MNAFTPGVRCLACRSHDLAVFNSNIIQCNDCMTIDTLHNLTEEYFYCLDKLLPDAVYSRKDIISHTGFDLNHYAYRNLTVRLFQKVSARKYKFKGRGNLYDF